MTAMLSRLLSYRISAVSHQLKQKHHATSAENHNVIELAYSCFEPTKGQPKDLPLVILHGLFGSKRNWNSMAHSFSNSGRKVIAVDARNHGDSAHAEAMDYLTMSQDVERLLAKLGIDKAIILGHSMGGKTAMCLALTKPHLVDKLIIEDIAPSSVSRSDTTVYPSYITAMRNVTFDETVKTLSDARRAADKQLHRVFTDKFLRAFILTNLRKGSTGFEWKINLDSVERHLDQIIGFPDITGTYHGDTLFIGGSKSNHIRQEDHPVIRSLFPNVRIEYIVGAGHWVHSEKPKELSEMVQDFIGDRSL